MAFTAAVLVGVALASAKIPNLYFMFLFAVGAIVMRGAGCIVNDIYDRHLDKMVERTQSRPLASGELKVWQASLLLVVLLIIGLGILRLFNQTTILVGVLSLLLVFAYPLMKRVTWWPQLFLGFTFNWGALMGWSAVKASLNLPILFLYAAAVFWTLGYDTIYAHQDIRDDEIVGIKSTARLFGRFSRIWVASFYGVNLILFLFVGWTAGLGQGFYGILLLALVYVTIQLLIWRMDDPENCLHRFRSNRDYGFIILAAIIIGKFI